MNNTTTLLNNTTMPQLVGQKDIFGQSVDIFWYIVTEIQNIAKINQTASIFVAMFFFGIGFIVMGRVSNTLGKVIIIVTFICIALVLSTGKLW